MATDGAQTCRTRVSHRSRQGGTGSLLRGVGTVGGGGGATQEVRDRGESPLRLSDAKSVPGDCESGDAADDPNAGGVWHDSLQPQQGPCPGSPRGGSLGGVATDPIRTWPSAHEDLG